MRTRHDNARTDWRQSAGHDGGHDDDGGRGDESQQDAGRSKEEPLVFVDSDPATKSFETSDNLGAKWARGQRRHSSSGSQSRIRCETSTGVFAVEVDMNEAAQSNIVDRCMEKSAMLNIWFVHHYSGPALTLHQSVFGENGLEVWTLFQDRYDPKTTLRNLQLWLEIMNPGKAKKVEGFPCSGQTLGGCVKTLKRDYGQEVAETARVGLLILMAPDELQGTVREHADRLREYRRVEEKKAMLLDARGQMKDPKAMDIGYSGEDWTWETELGDFDVGDVERSDHCGRCGGMAHIASECPTPIGNGKGKKDRGFSAKGMKGHENGKGERAGGKGHDMGKEMGQHSSLETWPRHLAMLDAPSSAASLEIHKCCR